MNFQRCTEKVSCGLNSLRKLFKFLHIFVHILVFSKVSESFESFARFEEFVEISIVSNVVIILRRFWSSRRF